MPDDGVSVVPTPTGTEEPKKMADPVDLSPNMANLLLTRTAQVGGVVEANLAEINKLLTFDHLENKRVVNMQQALGIREVQAKVTPGGPAPAA